MSRITIEPYTPREGRPRPDWLVCVVSDVGESHKLYGKTWCGKPRVGFVFQSVDHAALNGLAENRLMCCPECLAGIVAALANGHKVT